MSNRDRQVPSCMTSKPTYIKLRCAPVAMVAVIRRCFFFWPFDCKKEQAVWVSIWLHHSRSSGVCFANQCSYPNGIVQTVGFLVDTTMCMKKTHVCKYILLRLACLRISWSCRLHFSTCCFQPTIVQVSGDAEHHRSTKCWHQCEVVFQFRVLKLSRPKISSQPSSPASSSLSLSHTP